MKQPSLFNNTSNKTGVALNRTKRILAGFALAAAVLFPHLALEAAQAPVNLGAAGSFAILAKSGVSTVPASAVTGDIGVSPIDSTAVTGFSLTVDSSNHYSTSTQVTGRIYAPDYATPTPANLTTAVSDMETAFTDAAGRSLPDFAELGAGIIGGLTLAPGLYKWGTGVSIPVNVTFAGGPNDVWILQIAGDLTLAEATSVILSGGAQAKNIFWQVAGGVGVNLGTDSHFEGILLAQKGINLRTRASINGRLLAQTAVTLDANVVSIPTTAAIEVILTSASLVSDAYTDAPGHSVNLATKTITVPASGGMQFYQIKAATAVTITSITVSGGNAVILYN